MKYWMNLSGHQSRSYSKEEIVADFRNLISVNTKCAIEGAREWRLMGEVLPELFSDEELAQLGKEVEVSSKERNPKKERGINLLLIGVPLWIGSAFVCALVPLPIIKMVIGLSQVVGFIITLLGIFNVILGLFNKKT